MSGIPASPQRSCDRRRPERGAVWHWLWAPAVIAAVACALYGWGAYRYEHVLRPRLVRQAGSVDIGPLEPDVPPDVVLPPAYGRENAAGYYVRALQSFAGRRLPSRVRAMDPYAHEPMLAPWELHDLLMGARQSRCDLFEHRGGRPRFELRLPEGKAWSFAFATDPLASRPFHTPMRAMAQEALDLGRRAEREGRIGESARIYLGVVRLGDRLWRGAGALTDAQLGLEIEARALHYLAFLDRTTGDVWRLVLCEAYLDSLWRLQNAMQHKYAQLGNPEAAMWVLSRDASPLWRIEAAAALTTALRLGRVGWFQARDITRALRSARQDPDQHVREAVAALEEASL